MLRILPLHEAQSFIKRKAVRLAEAERVVAPILDAVRSRGDAAVIEYARRFDQWGPDQLDDASLTVPSSPALVSRQFFDALETAAKNIREYAELQLPRETWVDFPDGRRLGYIVRPLESMGAYIPAGRYPLPSTLLMTAVPAQVAGVQTICVASPHPSAEILATAHFLGIEKIYPHGWCTGHRGVGVRNQDHPESRPHRGPRQHLCRRR